MLKQQAAELQQQIANLYLQFPELKGDDEILRIDMLEGATSFKELLSVIADAKGEAEELFDGAAIRLENLTKRKGRFVMRAEFLRAMMMKIMQSAGVKKLELPEVTLSVKAGPQRIIGDPDPNLLPDELCRIKREPDRPKIRAALLAGQEVPGLVLSNAEPVLAVHTK